MPAIEEIFEIEITPEMVAAGVYEANEHCLGEGLQGLVSNVFIAMRLEELYAGRLSLRNKVAEVIDEKLTNA